MDHRGRITARRAPGRFRCLPCQRYVTGTESGHCPSCGFVPPSAPELPAEPRSQALVIAVVVVAIAIALFALL